MVRQPPRMHQQGVAAGNKQGEEWESGRCIVRAARKSRDEARRERVCLHVVDAHEGDPPCDRKAFRGVQARGKAGAHTRSAGDGDKVGLGAPCVWQDMKGLCNQSRYVLLMGFERYDGMYAAMGAVVGRDLLVEVELCLGSCVIGFLQYCYGCVVAITRYQNKSGMIRLEVICTMRFQWQESGGCGGSARNLAFAQIEVLDDASILNAIPASVCQK